MATSRNNPTQAGSNKALWAAVVVVIGIVLTMGVTLIRIQAPSQEPRPVVLPASTEAAANVSAAADSAATGPVTTAAPVQPAPAAQASGTQTNAPRAVPLRSSEPAVARAPAPGVSR